MVNKVILVGHLTADPEVRATPKGVYVANMRLATNTYSGKDEDQTNSWEDASTGQKKYRTEVVVDNFKMLGGKPQEKVA